MKAKQSKPNLTIAVSERGKKVRFKCCECPAEVEIDASAALDREDDLAPNRLRAFGWKRLFADENGDGGDRRVEPFAPLDLYRCPDCRLHLLESCACPATTAQMDRELGQRSGKIS